MTSIFIPSRYESTSGVTSVIVNDYSLFTTDGTTKPSTDINWNNKKITNLNTPTNPNDAVNKTYADLTFIGKNITEDINMLGKRITTLGLPILSGDAVRKGYVDLNFKNINPIPVVNSYMSILLSTSTVAYNDSTNNITNVSTPQNFILSINNQASVIKLLRDDNGMFLNFTNGHLTISLNSSEINNTSSTLFFILKAAFTGTTTMFSYLSVNNLIYIYLNQSTKKLAFEFGNGMNVSRLSRTLTDTTETNLINDYLMDKYRLKNFNMNGKVPTNVGIPTNSTDVVNKTYVDGMVKNIISLPFTGSFKAATFFMKNYICLYAMKVTRIAVYSDSSVLLSITITKNNVIINGGDISKSVGLTFGTKTYATPLTFAAGENLGIYCTTCTDTVTTYGVVNLIAELTI